MEKLNPNVVGLSVGIVAAIVYLACLVFVAIFPLQATITVGNYLMHGIDISSIATKDITFADSTIGLVIIFLGAAAIGYMFAFVYNWLNKKF